MTRAIISAGSNKNNPQFQVHQAVQELFCRFDQVIISNFYLTQPLGPVEQAAFVNAAISIDTDMIAPELLEYLLDIETRAGRNRMMERPKGPRSLDLDIILFGSEIWTNDNLQIPHPRFRERRFVLQPAVEIAPNILDPLSHKRLDELLTECRDSSWIKLLEEETLAV